MKFEKSCHVVNDYHEGGRPDLPTLAEDGTVKDVEISWIPNIILQISPISNALAPKRFIFYS